MAITTTALGFQKPDGTELVKSGDNVIAANAQKAEDRFTEDRVRLTDIEAKNTTQDGRLTVAETKNAAQDGRLDGLDSGQAFQGGRLALVEAAAGFTAPPLGFQDEIVKALVANPASLTGIDLAGRFASKGQTAYAKDTLLGDGTNEFTALQALFNRGGIIVMEAGKVYGYTPTATLTLPAGTTLLTNGATFKELASMGDTSTFRVNGDSYVDALRLDLAGGDTARGLLVAGDNTTIERINVKARVLSGLANFRRRGLVVGIEGTGSKNVRIGSVWVENWDYAVAVFDSTRITIGEVHMRNSRQGLLMNDVIDTRIESGTYDVLSTNAAGGPGENAVLLGSTRSDHSCRNVRINNFVSRTSSEHAFRLGGEYRAKNIWFNDCAAIKSGATAGGSGGCGFKALGPTLTMNSSATHSNIYFNNCIVENSLNLSGANTEAFYIGKCRNVTINNPIVRASAIEPSYAEGTTSAYAGIRIFGSRKVTINNPQIEKCQSHGIRIHDVADDGSTNNGGAMEDITVNGGLLQSNPYHIYVDLLLANTRRLKIDGTTTDAGLTGLYVTTASNTLTTRALARMNILGATTETVFGTERWVMDLTGDVLGAMPAGAGSKYANYANGQIFTRLGTSWYPVNLSGTTANRPAGMPKGAEYYDTTIDKKVWYNGTAWTDNAGVTA